jgi:hypothetical protein
LAHHDLDQQNFGAFVWGGSKNIPHPNKNELRHKERQKINLSKIVAYLGCSAGCIDFARTNFQMKYVLRYLPTEQLGKNILYYCTNNIILLKNGNYHQEYVSKAGIFNA